MKRVALSLCLLLVAFGLNATSNQKNGLDKKIVDIEKTRDGNYSGIDDKGNFYRGNSKTGFYHNYGTGATCYGLDDKRRCY